MKVSRIAIKTTEEEINFKIFVRVCRLYIQDGSSR